MMDQKQGMTQRKASRQLLRQHGGDVLSYSFVYLFLILMAAIVLFPFYWMIISSMKSLDEYRLSTPTFWPRVLMLSNYVSAFTTANLGRLFMNTMIVGLVSTLLSLVIFNKISKDGDLTL